AYCVHLVVSSYAAPAAACLLVCRFLCPAVFLVSSLIRTLPTAISSLSLHDALPICAAADRGLRDRRRRLGRRRVALERAAPARRSEEHTSELQSRVELVCRLLLEKKKNTSIETKRLAR